MQVFIGGSHNGKRNFVKALLKEQVMENIQWIEGGLPRPGSGRVVIAGIEKWLADTKLSESEAVSHVMKAIEGRKVIFILTDIGRGIVPMNADERNLRDVCGRLYQQLMVAADEVTRIWYGIPQNLKKRGE